MNQEPKFVPGERVLIDSKTRPDLNGEATVVSAEYEYWHGRGYAPASGWSYFTTTVSECGRPFNEGSLRKLPPNTPAEFDESLWAPKKEVV